MESLTFSECKIRQRQHQNAILSILFVLNEMYTNLIIYIITEADMGLWSIYLTLLLFLLSFHHLSQIYINRVENLT